jgi:methionyl-tRNA formyltransferase
MATKKPLFVFFGTPDLSVCVLDALKAHGYLPALIVTAPDRPRGRGLETTPTPVGAWGVENNIDVITPETLADPELLGALENTEWDVFVVAMYAKLLPMSILDLPRRGTLNVHPSLLPKFRGPSPVLSAILADERTTGVSIMQLTEKMDAGPIVAQARIEIDEDTGEGGWPPQGSEFEKFLATEGGNLLAETLEPWIQGEVVAENQDESLATYTQKFTSQDALVDLTGNPREQLLKIRAFDKSPRAHFIFAGKRVIITDAKIDDGKLVVLSVIPEGKKEMDYADFVRGAKV